MPDEHTAKNGRRPLLLPGALSISLGACCHELRIVLCRLKRLYRVTSTCTTSIPNSTHYIVCPEQHCAMAIFSLRLILLTTFLLCAALDNALHVRAAGEEQQEKERHLRQDGARCTPIQPQGDGTGPGLEAGSNGTSGTDPEHLRGPREDNQSNRVLRSVKKEYVAGLLHTSRHLYTNVIEANTSGRRCFPGELPGFLTVDGDKEKRRRRRARKKWKQAAKRNMKYSFRVGGNDGSPFYRTTSEETRVEELFAQIKLLLDRMTRPFTSDDFYDFEIKYHRKFGYPKLIKWSYYSNGACFCTETSLEISRLRSEGPML